MSPMALDGVRILDFTQMMLGPWGTQFLGDLGADVIKVERPRVGEWERGLRAMGELIGDDSPFFLAMNRNKRSLSVNLKEPEGRAIIEHLVRSVDVVTENYRPGVMDRLGLGYDALRTIKPDLIYVAGSGYGPSGPYVDRPGQDLLIQALSGLAAQSGRAGDPPTPLASSVVDATTALSLAFATMVGLFHKLRTGEGQRIDVNLFSTAIALQCQELTAYMNLDRRWDRSAEGIASPWLSAPFGIYQSANGYLAISMNPLPILAQLLPAPELADIDDAAAYRERDRIKRIVQGIVVQRPSDEWIELFQKHDLWCAKVQDFEDLLDDPQVAHNELIQTIRHPEFGDVRVVGMPIRFSRTPGTIRLDPPRIGQHNAEVLTDLGYTPERIAALTERGVI